MPKILWLEEVISFDVIRVLQLSDVNKKHSRILNTDWLRLHISSEEQSVFRIASSAAAGFMTSP